MKIWKILSPKILTTEERPDNLNSETQAKVKVTQLLLTEPELQAYNGTSKPKYPIVPGRFAVGLVVEAGENCTNVEKGSRVFIHDTTPCKQCEHCLDNDTENCNNFQIAGVNSDGYLRDFVVCEDENLSSLPSGVSDTEALFIGIVAMSEKIIDSLDLPKGAHVAVFGANELGNILSQLLIYHHAVPILVDNDEKRLELASKCGIYYTIKADDSMQETIERLTGGRLTRGSVHCCSNYLDSALPFKITADGGKVIYSGYSFSESPVSLKAALDKQLIVSSVIHDYSSISTAINLLFNKAINIEPFHIQPHALSETDDLFKNAADAAEKGEPATIAVINMLS